MKEMTGYVLTASSLFSVANALFGPCFWDLQRVEEKESLIWETFSIQPVDAFALICFELRQL